MNSGTARSPSPAFATVRPFVDLAVLATDVDDEVDAGASKVDPQTVQIVAWLWHVSWHVPHQLFTSRIVIVGSDRISDYLYGRSLILVELSIIDVVQYDVQDKYFVVVDKFMPHAVRHNTAIKE